FLTRDMFNGALADMSLGSNPWTLGRYTFAGGNPTTLIEQDGHVATCTPDGYSFCPDYDLASQPQAPADESPESSDPDAGLAPPPVIAPPIPFTPTAPPGVPPILRKAARGGAIAIIAGCALFCLAGDSGPSPLEEFHDDVNDEERGCASRTNSLSEIWYLPRDELGRATGAFACLTMSATDVDSRRARTPPGYQDDIMDRSHLIARQFGGTSDLENIVPLYKDVNQAMRRVETR
ncbi:MAG: DNA/RNA non-specific endonuclease, partial [Nitriliruptorales bacterium]